MPLPLGTKYRVKHTSKGNVRLAFNRQGDVIEAKNLKTGDVTEITPKPKRKKRRIARVGK